MGNRTIEINKTTPVYCTECGNGIFTQLYLLRHVSAIVSSDGQEALLPVPVFVCTKCNLIVDKNLRKLLIEENKEINI